MTEPKEGSTPLKPNTWEVFSNYYALENRTQHESYCLTYPKQAKNSSRETIDCHASNLMKNDKILTRIAYLKKTLEEQTIKEIVYTRQDSFKVFDENVRELKIRLKEIANDTELSFKDKIYLENMLRKNIKEQEEQKAKLWSLYVEKKALNVNMPEDWLDELD